MPYYEALVTIRVKTEVPHDNPAWSMGIDIAISKGRFDIVDVAKPFLGERPCKEHGKPKR